ncbi:hypothetical protein BU25DRAFT_414999 [Macroventuria anomochaeta]|uniref:Uncharacterized protein n=1 Tax=Macroventuria anomochaeta TaxID=301207 RepID=A0ACB6RPB3_9PLEO|nr:uncharacterized protein BU25DRAFT_414999 [Macroventuria anomochaeta]KAF2622749.1 hypothetical protein BU25DRAFT_414999 [Macroventuria anomochaeta]
MMVSLFTPVVRCRHKHLEPYMPPATAAFQNDKFAAYGLPNGSFSALQLEACNTTTFVPRCSSPEEHPPLVLFSGALGTSRLIYSSMLQSVAAAGYSVVSIDHPYDADFVEFPEGTTVKGADIDSDADIELALATRVRDIAFVHRQLGNQSFVKAVLPDFDRGYGYSARKTAMVGHSLGGAAAAAAVLAISSIRGGVNLDGTMFGSVITSGLKRPFMLMGHENKTQETDPSWKATWTKLTGWKREFEVEGAAHYSFSDLPLVTEVLGLQENLPQEVGQVLGTIEGCRMLNLTVSYVTAFLDFVLKAKPDGNSNKIANFSEVTLRAE